MIEPDARTVIAPAIGPQWRRLHPLSPLVRLGAMFAALLLIGVSSIGRSQTSNRAAGTNWVFFVYLGLGALGVLGGILSWWVTRWRVDGGDLQVEKGVILRRSIRIPLIRIQAIDVVAPLTARVLGLAEVRIVSAGRGAERARLAYLSAADAATVRAELLALAHGLAPETPEPFAYPLLRVDNGRLAAALLTRGWSSLIVLGLLLGLVGASAASQSSGALLAAFLPFVGGAILPLAHAFNEDFGFAVSEAGDGVRLDRGLLQTRHETIPYGRIQAVRLVQPLVWRAFGWCRLDVDVARQRAPGRAGHVDAQRFARTLIPVATREEVGWLLSRVMPGATITPPAGSGPPRRAAVKAPLSYHFLALWLDQDYMCARTGRVRAMTVVVPLDKVQSVRLVSGPVQRLLGLATVHVDTAGHRWQAKASCRDETEATSVIWSIADLSRHARRRFAPSSEPIGEGVLQG